MKQKSKTGRGGRRPGAGRKPFAPTIEQRLTVERLKYVGESEEVIAAALAISPITLRKHFVVELRDGYANQRKQVMEMLFKAAQDGNVTAIKKLEESGRAAGAQEAIMRRSAKRREEREEEPAPAPVPRAPDLGKKELQQQAAEAVGGKFAVPAGPKLAVDNT